MSRALWLIANGCNFLGIIQKTQTLFMKNQLITTLIALGAIAMLTSCQTTQPNTLSREEQQKRINSINSAAIAEEEKNSRQFTNDLNFAPTKIDLGKIDLGSASPSPSTTTKK